jgi:hypothetical protein
VQRLLCDARPIRRATTVVVAATCLALQLFATFHLLTVEHGLCAEHGEPIDVERAAKPGFRLLDRSRTAETGPAASPGTPSDNGVHDHCLLTARCSSSTVVVQAAKDCPSCAPVLVKGPGAADRWSMPLSVLRLLAPKTSPPA